MVLLELLVPHVIGPPQVSHVLGRGVVVVNAHALRTGEVEHELAGQPPGRAAFPGDRRPVPAHHERDVEVVVLAGPGEARLVAQHLGHHDVEAIVARLVQLAELRAHQLVGGQA